MRSVRFAFALSFFIASLTHAGSSVASDYSPLPPPRPPAPTDTQNRVPTRPAPVETKPAKPAQVEPAPTTSNTVVQPAGGTSPSASAPPEHTAPTLDDDRFTLSLLLGAASNNLDFGLGLRGGVTAIAPHVWVGGTLLLHSSSSGGSAAGYTYSASSTFIYGGPEVGYDIELGPVIVRPYGALGIGVYRFSSSGVASGSLTSTHFLAWGGGTLLYGIPKSRYFVGGDMRLITVPAGPAFALYGFGGIAF